MHQKLCSIIFLSALASAALAQYARARPLQQHPQPNQDIVNVVLEPSCWTSDSCRREFKDRFNGSVLQLRVPWQVIYPTFNGALIRSAVQDLQTASNTVEPLFIFENQVEVAHLHGIAYELSSLKLPRSAFLLDSRDATENLAVITKELSIIHTVFRRQLSPTFYNVPPSSFLSTKHLHKYLCYVRKHVTGIRLPVSDSNLSLESLDEILTVISQNSFVPQVEVKSANRSAFAHHNVTVFVVVGSEDLLEALPRPRRSLPSGGFNWNAAFKKASPLQAPPVTWSERRANAKRNLIKLFGSMANSKKDTRAALKDSKLLSLAKTTTPGGGATPEERIFVSSENPKFPKEDVAFSLSDRRGDLTARRDFEYVEYGPREASLARDLSEEDEETRELSPRKKHHRHGTTKKPARRLELWEMESPPSPLRSNRQGGNLRLYREDEEEAHPFSGFQLKAEPLYYAPEENFTTGGQLLYPEQRPREERRLRGHRMRRDIFGHQEAVGGAVHSLFHDIRDNYPKMLERLADVMRPEALPQVSPLHEEDHISNLLDSETVRRTRSSPFIHEDPTLNEIPYKFPVPAATLPPIIIEPRNKGEEGSSVASLVDILMDGWHTLKNHLQNFFW